MLGYNTAEAEVRRDAEYQEHLLQQQEAENDAAAERDAILYAEKGAFDVIDDSDVPLDITTTSDPATLTDEELDRLFGKGTSDARSAQESASAPAAPSAGNPAASSPASTGRSQNEGLTLSSYSADEIRARETARDSTNPGEAEPPV